MNRPTIKRSLNIIPEMRFKIHLTMIMSLNWGEYKLHGLHFNNVEFHIITKETIHHALEQIPLFRLYINMYNQQSPLIQTTPGFVVVELPDHLFSSEEYSLRIKRKNRYEGLYIA